jgi:predicted MFS family arabinose efflux permease
VDAVIRTQWRVLSNSEEEIRSLHALDSIIEEASYLVGPTLASVALIVFGAQNAMLLLGGVGAAGVLLAYLPKTLRAALRAEPPVRPSKTEATAAPPTLTAFARALAGPIVDSNLQRIVTPLLLLGAALGSLGILVPAISQGMGNIAYSGFLFSAISVGGLIGGLWYGAAKLKSRLSTRQAVFSIVLGAPLILGVWALNPWLLVPILIVSGLAVTPLYINAYLLMDQDLPKAVAHEANTWVSVGNNLGYTFGIVFGGWLLSATGIGTVGVLVTAIGATTVVFAITVLVRGRRPTSEKIQSDAVEAS